MDPHLYLLNMQEQEEILDRLMFKLIEIYNKIIVSKTLRVGQVRRYSHLRRSSSTIPKTNWKAAYK